MTRTLNVVHALPIKAWMCPYMNWVFSGAQEQICPNILPDATSKTQRR